MQNCKSIVAIVFKCYFVNQPLHCNVSKYGLHYIVLLEMMVSVLQDVEGLIKALYFPGGRPFSMHNFRFNVYTVYFFDVHVGSQSCLFCFLYNPLSKLLVSCPFFAAFSDYT